MAQQTKSFAELHAAGFGRWRLPTARQIGAISDHLKELKETLPAPNSKSYQAALWRIRLQQPSFLTH